MNRPLLVTDCDEVLLYMAVPFRDWLAEARNIHFAIEAENWNDALTHRDIGERVAREDVLPLVHSFFETETARQMPVPGAIEALERLARVAKIVILTNLPGLRSTIRIDQLAGHGIHYETQCNQGGKGHALAAILEERKPPVTVFVDDLASQHASVARHAPEAWRLQMVAEPLIASLRDKAPEAHARIDQWPIATDWILARFAEGPPRMA
jgi:hypothetical protein